MKVNSDIEADEGGLSSIVGRIRQVLLMRWLTLVIVSVAVFALGAGLVLMLSPKYTSTTHVRIDPSRTPVAAEQQSDSQSLSPEAIETEVTMIKSADIARTVVRKLRLLNDPEYNKASASNLAMSPADRETSVAAALLDRLDVNRAKLSYILGISFTSKDRLKSATIANAFANEYLYAKVGSKTDAAGKKATFLKTQLDALSADIRAKEAQLASYQGQVGIVSGLTSNGGSTGTIVDQQISPLSAQLAEARSEAAQANAVLSAARSQQARGGIDTVADVLASPVIGQFRTQRAEALRDLGDVLSRYGEKHPATVAARSKVADADAQLKAEAERIMSSLQSRAGAASARLASLEGSMGRLASQQASNARSAVQGKSLDAEVTTERAQYEKLSQNLLDMQQAATNQIAQAEVIDVATPPLRPTSPNKPLLLALVFLVALSAGASTVAVQEMLVSGLRSAADVEERLGLPLLATIPKERHKRPADLLLEKPTSLFSESMRIARASIMGVRGTSAPQIVAITSALPSEGKTTTALAFARTLAVNGQHTLLIDCDVRRAVLRQLVSDQSTKPGLVELLHGKASLDDTIEASGVENLDHLLVKEPFFSSGNLFGDGKMEQILAGLRGRYEAIVLDLPPIMGLADGRFLAVMADSVALVVRWDATPAQAASAALASLQSDGAKIAGVIFTMVDSSAEAVGSLYYSKKYSGYYQQA
ncbi:MAG: polysaccharide biosynthesis tyrosine autokinase [Sphingomonas bacterium]